MKRTFALAALILCFSLFAGTAYSQTYPTAFRIWTRAALPATCNPAAGDVVVVTTAPVALYSCTAANTWRPAGFAGNGQVWNQGVLTLDTPVINHTATWNNGVVTFHNIISDITDTASAGGSQLIDLRVGGATQFAVTKAGIVQAQYYQAANTGDFYFGTFSRISSGADGRINLTNNAAADFTRLSFGPEAVTHPAITVSAAVAGQTQGIIITKADGTSAVFANLGAATNGSMIYCSDCTIASPCAGGGNGAIAKRLNAIWVCN
jgi:hypothetical protein